MISKISQMLNFETDSSKFDTDEIDQEINNLFNSSNKFNSFDENENANENDSDEKPFYQMDYNNQIINFKTQNDLASFISNKSKYIDPFYVFHIPKPTHVITVKMRSIELIIGYLLKYNKYYISEITK